MSGDPGPRRPAISPLTPASAAHPGARRRARALACALSSFRRWGLPRWARAPIRLHRWALAPLLLAVIACAPSPDEVDDGKLPATDAHCAPDVEGVFPDTADPEVDYDCDGWPKSEDCNNRNSEIHPTAPEFNNGVDDDCDGDAGLLYGCGAGGNESLGLGALLIIGLARRGRPPTRAPRAGEPRGLPCDPTRDGAP